MTFSRAAMLMIALSLPGAAFAQTAAPAAAPTTPPAASTPAPSADALKPKPEDAARQKFRAACSRDIVTLCGDAAKLPTATPDEHKAQRAQVGACLTSNKDKLSSDCRSAVAEREAAAAAKAK